MAAIMDFSVARGDDLDVAFALDPNDRLALSGAQATWAAFWQEFAVPEGLESGGEAILKDSGAGQIDILPSPAQLVVHLTAADTINLPCGNFYHEADVVAADGARATVAQGMMTVTLSMIA